ncbi:MAG: hypothetical protein IPH93_13060 [Saprospiraceae bacterium]|nr:hypothetical protein [Saprospiraceae bacterium]
MKYYFFFFVILVLFNGCCKDCNSGCAQFATAYEINFYCLVYDKLTNETIMGNCNNCPYSNIGSVLLDQKGDTVRSEGTITPGGGMSIYLVKKGRDSVDYPIHQEYYLHLVNHFGVEKDVDTIKFDFTLINSNRCEKFDYKDFRCYYNDSLYLTVQMVLKGAGYIL